jgi:hypothetical protein
VSLDEWKLDQLDKGLRALKPSLRLEIRPMDVFGYWISVESDGSSFRCSVVVNNYYAPARGMHQRRRAALVDAGWKMREDVGHVRPGQTVGRLTFPGVRGKALASVAESLQTCVRVGLGDRSDNVDALLVEPRRAIDRPPFPHAISFWDWKDPIPFDEFTVAHDRLRRANARRVVFNEVATGGDDYAVVIAPRKLPDPDADALWTVALNEMPSEGGRQVFWRC